jgi:hypothetical protein
MTKPWLQWVAELHDKYRRELSFQELRKGVVALSRIYVERRGGLAAGAVFDGAAKRAAFACFYSPLHFLLVREIVQAVQAHVPAPKRIMDLGCGLGVAGAAWATLCSPQPSILGYEKSGWAAAEARLLLEALSLRGRVHRKPLEAMPVVGRGDGLVAAFVVNELDPSARDALSLRLLEAASRGASVLVVEPIAARPLPWWPEWSERFRAASGREDSWRFPCELPEEVLALDRAAGLDHRELTARSLFVRGRGRKVKGPSEFPNDGATSL